MYVNYNRVTNITLDEIAHNLATNDAWLERAILVLHARQTRLEQTAHETLAIKNEVGFQRADALLFSRYAEYIKTQQRDGRSIGSCLTKEQKLQARRPWHRAKVAQPVICKYRKQILDEIERAAKAKLEKLSS